MLYWLTALSDGGDVFNLFRYITFRAGGAFFTALLFGFLFGPPLINVLRRRQGKGQPIRADGPEGHFAKAGTPTMGGLLILLAVLSSTLLWARLDNGFVWIVLFVTFSFGLIGFADDYAKVSRQTAAGVPSKLRLALGFAIAAIAAYFAMSLHPDPLQYQVAMPVFKNLLLNFSFLFLPFAMLVIVGSANAVNLTDGLDGLAIMPVMIAAGALGVIAYAVGRVDFTSFLKPFLVNIDMAGSARASTAAVSINARHAIADRCDHYGGAGVGSNSVFLSGMLNEFNLHHKTGIP